MFYFPNAAAIMYDDTAIHHIVDICMDFKNSTMAYRDFMRSWRIAYKINQQLGMADEWARVEPSLSWGSTKRHRHQVL